MKISIEISMYPLNENFGELILKFIKKIKSYPNISTKTNSMSTQIFGEYEEVMHLLKEEIKSCQIYDILYRVKIASEGGQKCVRYDNRMTRNVDGSFGGRMRIFGSRIANRCSERHRIFLPDQGFSLSNDDGRIIAKSPLK